MFGRRTLEYDDELYVRRRRGLRVRRLVGVAILLVFVWGFIWLAFFSGLADPVAAAAAPFLDKTAALINDPLGIDWGGKLVAVALVVIPHMGLLLFILDDYR